MSILGQSIFTYNYERSILHNKGCSLLGELGLGLGEFSESDASNPSPATIAFNVWLPLQYTMGLIDLTATVSPTFYKQGKLGFVDLNGVFGFRINFKRNSQTGSLFFGVYYNNKIYSTVSHPEDLYSFIPI